MSKYSQRLRKAKRSRKSPSNQSGHSHLAGPHFEGINQLAPPWPAEDLALPNASSILDAGLEAKLAEATQARREGRLTDARVLCETILLERPDHAYALHYLGLLHLEAGDAGTAVKLFDRAIALEPPGISHGELPGTAKLSNWSSSFQCHSSPVGFPASRVHIGMGSDLESDARLF